MRCSRDSTIRRSAFGPRPPRRSPHGPRSTHGSSTSSAASDGMTTEAAAIAALAGRGETVRDRIDPWADREVNRAIELTRARAVLRAGGPTDDCRSRLPVLDPRPSDPARRDHGPRARWRRSALRRPVASSAAASARRDPDVRAQAIEALDSIGDRRLGRSVARLIEESPDRHGRGRDDGAPTTAR